MSEPSDEPNEPRVKDLIDSATRADLERWFGLPSFTELSERGINVGPDGQAVPAGQTGAPAFKEDPEVVEARKRREAAIAAVDPVLFEAHQRRTNVDSLRFVPIIELAIDLELGRLDLSMLGNRSTSHETREVEIPYTLEDDLKICTPQALLRDLHRSEAEFPRQMEISEALSVPFIDPRAVVSQAMTERRALPPPASARFHEVRSQLAQARAERQTPWAEIKTPNRRVTE